MQNGELQHPILGRLIVQSNVRARRIIFRATDEGLKVTVSPRTTERELRECIEEMLPRLQQLQQRHQSRHAVQSIGPDFRIDTPHFKMHLEQGEVRRPQARLAKGELVITYPSGTDFSSPTLQTWMVKVAEECLRHIAKNVLPNRLSELARQHGFQFTTVKIHKTHGRWGSCNTRRNINLSLYLLLLPAHLQDYVMLHELCHTLEMNHSPRFWAQLDRVTMGRSEAMRREMKRYDTSIFT